MPETVYAAFGTRMGRGAVLGSRKAISTGHSGTGLARSAPRRQVQERALVGEAEVGLGRDPPVECGVGAQIGVAEEPRGQPGFEVREVPGTRRAQA